MRIYKTWSEALDPKQLASVVSELQQGALMVWPTDTLYAVACSALDVKAIERLCRLKNINPDKTNLSIVCADISQASDFAGIDNKAFRLLRDNLPGPFTFILPASPRLAKAFKGRREVGVRVSGNEIARRLASELGNPLLSASAIWEDADPEALGHAEEVKMRMEPLGPDAFIDAGDVPGVETAVVSLMDSDAPEMLREGPETLRGL